MEVIQLFLLDFFLELVLKIRSPQAKLLLYFVFTLEKEIKSFNLLLTHVRASCMHISKRIFLKYALDVMFDSILSYFIASTRM